MVSHRKSRHTIATLHEQTFRLGVLRDLASNLGGTLNYYYRDAAYRFRRFDVTTRQRIVPPER